MTDQTTAPAATDQDPREPFRFTDADGDYLHIGIPATPASDGPAISFHTATEPVHVPVERIPEVIATLQRLAAAAAGEVSIAASEIELEGGDVMLQEMSVGDPIEIEKQTGLMGPGTWVITAFETEDRSRARVRQLTREEIAEFRRRWAPRPVQTEDGPAASA